MCSLYSKNNNFQQLILSALLTQSDQCAIFWWFNNTTQCHWLMSKSLINHAICQSMFCDVTTVLWCIKINMYAMSHNNKLYALLVPCTIFQRCPTWISRFTSLSLISNFPLPGLPTASTGKCLGIVDMDVYQPSVPFLLTNQHHQ